MILRRWLRRIPLLVALSVGAGTVAAPVDAQPGKGKHKEKRQEKKERREDRKEKVKERREDNKEKRQENRADRREKRKAKCEANPECKARKAKAKARWAEKKDEAQAARKEWRSKLPERRKKARRHLKKKWGGLLKFPAVRQELKLHARRLARLQRVRFVATQVEDTEAVARVDKLIVKEKARHQAHMETLRTKKGGE